MTTALLIIDLQRALCVGEYACHEVEAVIGRINGLIAKARESATPVVFVQHEEDGYEPLRHGSEGWQIDDRLQVRPEDRRVFKTSPDSFHKTDLDAALKGLGVTHLVICGAQSDFCVDTSTRRALSAGYDVTLVEDGHTTIDEGGGDQLRQDLTLNVRVTSSASACWQAATRSCRTDPPSRCSRARATRLRPSDSATRSGPRA